MSDFRREESFTPDWTRSSVIIDHVSFTCSRHLRFLLCRVACRRGYPGTRPETEETTTIRDDSGAIARARLENRVCVSTEIIPRSRFRPRDYVCLSVRVSACSAVSCERCASSFLSFFFTFFFCQRNAFYRARKISPYIVSSVIIINPVQRKNVNNIIDSMFTRNTSRSCLRLLMHIRKLHETSAFYLTLISLRSSYLR